LELKFNQLKVKKASKWSISGLAITKYDVFVAGEFAKAAWTARVEFVGTDSDFSAKSKFSAVVETGGSIDHHGRTVNTESKFMSGGKA